MGNIYLNGKPYDPHQVFLYYFGSRKETFDGQTIENIDKDNDNFITISELNGDKLKFIRLAHQYPVTWYFAENLEAAKIMKKAEEERKWVEEMKRLDRDKGPKW